MDGVGIELVIAQHCAAPIFEREAVASAAGHGGDVTIKAEDFEGGEGCRAIGKECADNEKEAAVSTTADTGRLRVERGQQFAVRESKLARGAQYDLVHRT